MKMVINISEKNYERLSRVLKECGDGKGVEEVLEEELKKVDVFVERMGWDNW